MILNAGAGQVSYQLPGSRLLNADLVLAALVGLNRSICADIHRLPLRSNTIRTVICIGSVTGYLDLPVAVEEFARVLTDGGSLLLDYERSGHRAGSRRAAPAGAAVPSFGEYRGVRHPFWSYADAYVDRTVESSVFEIVAGRHYHLFPRNRSVVGATLQGSLSFLERHSPEAIARWFGAANRLVLCRRRPRQPQARPTDTSACRLDAPSVVLPTGAGACQISSLARIPERPS